MRDDASNVSPQQCDEAIALAVTRYSQDRPVKAVKDVSVNGQLVDVPVGWVPGFSKIDRIEYPIGRVPTQTLATDRHSIYQTPTVEQIMLLDALPAAAQIRIVFTTTHTLNGSADTIPAAHRELVAKYAAALLCDQLAALYANSTDSTIQADSVQQGSKSQAYGAAANRYRKAYSNGLGVQDLTAAPAGTVVQMKSSDSLGGPRLYHPSRGVRQ